MSFTGQLGTPNSEFGNIVLGSVAAAQAGSGGTQSVSVSDFGVGLDLASFVGPLSGTTIEQAVGLDTPLLGLTLADTGVGEELVPTIPVTAVPSESGTGNEITSITATLPTIPDRGTGIDTPVLTQISNDLGFGTDTASFVDTTPPCLAASGILGDPLARLGPEYFLPHWTTANANRTGLLFDICQYVAEGEIQFKNQAVRDASARYLTEAKVLEPLYEWTIDFVPPTDRELTITFQASSPSGTVSGRARRAISKFDYDTTIDPVWYQDTISPVIKLRNLFMHTINGFSPSGVYNICGPGTAAYFGVIPDTGYYYRRSPSNNWDWISPESSNFGSQVVTLPGTGTWQIGYGSIADLASLLDNGTVVISWFGGTTPQLPLRLNPVRNIFDGYGSILGVDRIITPIEGNLSYKNRLISLTLAPPDTTIDGVIRGVGTSLALVNRVQWDGITTLNLDPSNVRQITSVKVVGINRFHSVNELLLPLSDSLHFHSSYSSWRQGAIIFIDGIPVNNYTVSGNVVSFFQPVTGTVNALYSIESYRPIIGAGGFISSVVPGQGISSGSYTVFYTTVVNAHTVDLPDYQAASLLLPNGLPNALFLEIAGKLSENNPTAFGRARWGGKTTWLEETDQKPSVSRLPIPFDSNTSNG